VTRLLQRDVDTQEPASQRICGTFVPAQGAARRSASTRWTRSCYAEWGRRSCARYRGLVAFAGWREYRAGDTVNDSRPRPSFGAGGP